jgi:hypothetical protein
LEHFGFLLSSKTLKQNADLEKIETKFQLKFSEIFNRNSKKFQRKIRQNSKKILTAKNRNFCFRKEKNQMENDQLRQFVQQISREQEKKIAQEKRRNYFKEIGRKGGLKKKTSNQFTRVVSTRLTQKEFDEAIQEAKRYNLKFSKYTRIKITNGELRINEFKEHETLLDYGNNFIRIKNMFRRSEFSQLDHTKVILREVEIVTKLIYDYLYNKMKDRYKENFQEDE